MTVTHGLESEVARIAELHDQIAELRRLQEQAQATLLLRMKFKMDAGALDPDRLTDIYMATRHIVTKGFDKQWNASLDVKIHGVYGRAHHRAAREARKARAIPNGPGGTWVGAYPFDRDCPMPPKGTAVVYVLYDEIRSIYVGSTSDMQTRLRSHARERKIFSRWSAIPCANRTIAYELEDQLLRDHKLPMNTRAGR